MADTTRAADARLAAVAGARAAYTAMWADMAAAARTADYQDPILAAHAAGAALASLVQGLYDYRRQSWVIDGVPVTRPRATSATPAGAPSRVSILDCLDDTRWLVYKASGGLANSSPGGHRKVAATVDDLSGRWKVTHLTTGGEGSC